MGKLAAWWSRWRAWRRDRRRGFVVEDDDSPVWTTVPGPALFSGEGDRSPALFAGAGGTFDGGGASGDWSGDSSSDSSSDSGSDSSGSDSGSSDGGSD